jgi:hypothetical protein
LAVWEGLLFSKFYFKLSADTSDKRVHFDSPLINCPLRGQTSASTRQRCPDLCTAGVSAGLYLGRDEGNILSAQSSVFSL